VLICSSCKIIYDQIIDETSAPATEKASSIKRVCQWIRIIANNCVLYYAISRQICIQSQSSKFTVCIIAISEYEIVGDVEDPTCSTDSTTTV